MPRSKRGRSAPDYDSDHEDHLAASDDDDALMDDDDEEALTDDEEEEVFEECEEMDEDEDDDIDRCADGGEDEHDGGDDDEEEEDEISALRPFWPTEEDVDELQLMVARLRMEKQALLQSKRASAFRGDHREQRPNQTPAQAQTAELRRQRRHAKTLLAWLEKRSLCRAYVVNRLGLALTWDERMQARKLGFLQQEWFCAMRDASNQLQENLYTPQNTLEMRLYELISFRGLGRMRRILTEVKNADGKWERYVLMHPPQHAGKDARRRGVQADPALRKWHNEMKGIYVNRPVYSPSPPAD